MISTCPVFKSKVQSLSHFVAVLHFIASLIGSTNQKRRALAEVSALAPALLFGDGEVGLPGNIRQP